MIWLTQFLAYLVDEFVDPLGGSTKFAGLGTDHLYELRYFLTADLSEPRKSFQARVKLVFFGVAIEVLK